MNREARDTLLLSRLHQRIEESEAIHLRLKVVVEERLEGRHLWVHNHDITCDTILTECHTLISHSHSKIVDTMVLQSLGYLYGASPIGISLYHTYQLGRRFEERAIPIEVVNHGIKVHLQHRFMYLLHQEFC